MSIPLPRSGHGPAIATMCAGVGLLVMSDMAAKDLVARFSPFHIMFARSAIALPLVTLLILSLDGPRSFRTRRPAVHFARAALIMGATWTFFLSMRVMPLAEATALVLTAPFFVTALSVPILKERVGAPRWIALAVGFAGAMVILQPGGGTVQWAALLPLAAAVCYALTMISARFIDAADSPRTMMFYLTLFPFLMSSVTLLFDWPPVGPRDLMLFAVMAVVGTLGVTLISQAFRMAPAAVVAPLDYTALVWAGIAGWLIWDEVPGAALLIGGGIVVAAGLFVIWREGRAAQ
ncbi:DMT family transporter [Roseobacter sp. HKCCA0434]|uniref:DMT family transporter n=1 Tax=Roseobacter sp. HKCCA0434 TaxID=3079297 RepID=UPI002905D174|nr:DMT family transporter [Roseobacter sp. HKCCA0434]